MLLFCFFFLTRLILFSFTNHWRDLLLFPFIFILWLSCHAHEVSSLSGILFLICLQHFFYFDAVNRLSSVCPSFYLSFHCIVLFYFWLIVQIIITLNSFYHLLPPLLYFLCNLKQYLLHFSGKINFYLPQKHFQR